MVVTPAVSVPKPSSSKGNCTLAVTTEDPEAEDGLCGVDNGLVAPCVPLPVPPDRLVL